MQRAPLIVVQRGAAKPALERRPYRARANRRVERFHIVLVVFQQILGEGPARNFVQRIAAGRLRAGQDHSGDKRSIRPGPVHLAHPFGIALGPATEL